MVTIDDCRGKKNLIFYHIKTGGQDFKGFCKLHKLNYSRCYGFLHFCYPLKTKSGKPTPTLKEIQRLIKILNIEYPEL